MMTKWV